MEKGKEKTRTDSKVTGYKDLCLALGISSKSGDPDADRKRFYRVSKKYGFPVHRDGKTASMLREDVETINDYYLLGASKIAEYLGIHIKTLYKWLKQFPKIPIKRRLGTKRSIAFAFKPDLSFWLAVRLSRKHKRESILKGKRFSTAPVKSDMRRLYKAMDFAGYKSIKELKSNHESIYSLKRILG